MTASLPMYPLAGLRPATERWWAEVAGALGSTEALAPWGADDGALWRDPDLTLSQACGWPVATSLAGAVRVLGALAYRTPRWRGTTYASVIVAGRPGAVAEFRGGRAAVNSLDSLSGWISLVAALGCKPADLVITGAHLGSLHAVQAGTADVAAIDALTLDYVRRLHPELVDGLHEVGRGPDIPTLPLITSIRASDAEVAALRSALASASRSPAAAELWIDGFAELDEADYAPIRALEPAP